VTSCADLSRAYPTTTSRLRLISDLTTHTYSVFLFGALAPQSDVFEIARQFRFRTEQASVTHLDRLSAIVDGDHGSVRICISVSVPTDVVYSREGVWTAAPFANDEAVLTNGATTTHVDATGHVLATVDRSGWLATDALGNAYLAKVASGTLTVDKYAAPLALQWSTAVDVGTSNELRALAGLPDGSAAVAVGSFATPPTVQVLRFTPDGAVGAPVTLPGSVAVIDGDRTLTAWNDSSTVHVAAYAADGALIWERVFTGRAFVNAMAVDPAHALVFGGEFQTPIDFGSGPLRSQQTEDGRVNGYAVKLTSSGDHVFSGRLGINSVSGIATNGVRIAVSGTRRTQFFYLQLKVFDANTAPADSAQLFDKSIMLDRYETMLRFSKEAPKDVKKAAAYTFACLTPFQSKGLIILPTHRIIRERANFHPAQLLRSLEKDFEVKEQKDLKGIEAAMAKGVKEKKIVFGLVLKHALPCFSLHLKPSVNLKKAIADKRSDAYKGLDVAVLQALVLEACLGMTPESIAAQENIAFEA